jgi:Zn-dependent oligopeptidase
MAKNKEQPVSRDVQIETVADTSSLLADLVTASADAEACGAHAEHAEIESFIEPLQSIKDRLSRAQSIAEDLAARLKAIL